MAQFSAEATAQLAEFLEKEGREWVQQFIAQRKAFLAKRKIKASGDLIDSMRYEIESTLESYLRTSIDVQFQLYGRFIDMKNLAAPSGGSEYIAALEDWIVRRGFEQKFLSAFMANRKLKRPPKHYLNQLAWGIAIKRKAKVRRRAWYAKSKAAATSDLYNRVAAGLPEIVADELRKSFN